MGVYIISYVSCSVEFEIDYIRVGRRAAQRAARGSTRRENAHSLRSHFPIHEFSRLGPFRSAIVTRHVPPNNAYLP
jgi:hypothetical protein